MSNLVTGLFVDSKKAGEAVSDFKEMGYTDEVSIVTKDRDGDVDKEKIKDNTGEDVAKGAGYGALIGAIAGVVTVALPGAPLVVGGPVLASWGISGAALGALSGGIVGALTDLGIDEEVAQSYESHILAGDVLVLVTVDEDDAEKVVDKMANYGAIEIAHVDVD